MIAKQSAQNRKGGIVVVEFAVVTSFVLLPLLLGIWELGRILELQQVLTNAAREGGRAASAGQMTSSQIQTVITNYITNNNPNILISTGNLTIVINDVTTPGTDPSQATQGDQLYVSVSTAFSNVRWDLSVFKPIIDPNTVVTGSGVWYSLKDLSYPAPSPPTGQ